MNEPEMRTVRSSIQQDGVWSFLPITWTQWAGFVIAILATALVAGTFL